MYKFYKPVTNFINNSRTPKRRYLFQLKFHFIQLKKKGVSTDRMNILNILSMAIMAFGGKGC